MLRSHLMGTCWRMIVLIPDSHEYNTINVLFLKSFWFFHGFLQYSSSLFVYCKWHTIINNTSSLPFSSASAEKVDYCADDTLRDYLISGIITTTRTDCIKWRMVFNKILIVDGHQCHQYQQKKQLFLSIRHQKTTT